MVKGSSDDWIPSGVIVVLQERERKPFDYVFVSVTSGRSVLILAGGGDERDHDSSALRYAKKPRSDRLWTQLTWTNMIPVSAKHHEP